MSGSTVKAAVTRKRQSQTVENTEFDAFARRILRAYGRRVAAGDVEALRSLTVLAAEIDTVTRDAVTGLRQPHYGYSWAEIASRLGVTRQAAQARYGARTDRPDRSRLDERLIETGLCVSVAVLVAVFADHHPGTPRPATCPGCGYRYPDGVTDCPTNATVRPLLHQRRAEDRRALAVLTPDQLADLHNQFTARSNRTAARQAATHPMPSPRTESLLDLLREDSTP